jgi:ECF sigma factor
MPAVFGMLQPTELVHKAYLRLVEGESGLAESIAVLRPASQMMRRILVDRARAHKMAKRSGRWARVPLDGTVPAAKPTSVDVLDLDAALTRLAGFDPRKSQIAELKFFGGLSLEIGENWRCRSPLLSASGRPYGPGFSNRFQDAPQRDQWIQDEGCTSKIVSAGCGTARPI